MVLPNILGTNEVESGISKILGRGDEQAKLAVIQQLGAFLILEFGIIFHSVIISLDLGVAGDKFSTLYMVLVFHQSFEV